MKERRKKMLVLSILDCSEVLRNVLKDRQKVSSHAKFANQSRPTSLMSYIKNLLPTSCKSQSLAGRSPCGYGLSVKVVINFREQHRSTGATGQAYSLHLES